MTESRPPRLLVVTDADLAPTSRGAGRTLLNLLSAWPADAARVITTADGAAPVDPHGHRVVDAAWHVPGGLRDRLRPFVGDVQAQLMSFVPLDETAVKDFAAERLLVVPTSASALVLGARWAASVTVPSATWLMDDWVQQYDVGWISGSANTTAKALLAANAGWLVISDYLGEELRRWTGITRPTHVVHNAVQVGEPPAALTTPRHGRFTLRYAGTIWPMHADALTTLARAVALCRANGADIELILHTDRRGWEMYEREWRDTGTVFGDLVPYETLRSVLGHSDLLVVASSFSVEHARMSKSSVQTKITDYMATGRAMLNVGPADGACARFLRERDIALCADSPRVEAMAGVLSGAMRDRQQLSVIARRAWTLCARDHEIGAVGERTASFLRTLTNPTPNPERPTPN